MYSVPKLFHKDSDLGTKENKKDWVCAKGRNMTSTLPFEDDRCNNAWWKIRMTHNYFLRVITLKYSRREAKDGRENISRSVE